MLLQHAAPAATGIAATAATATAATISEWHLCLINARWVGGNVRLLFTVNMSVRRLDFCAFSRTRCISVD